jgi:hypothetical protein
MISRGTRVLSILALVALTSALTGCGGSSSDSSSGSGAVVPAKLTDTAAAVKISGADFAKWSEISAGARGFKCEHPRMVFGDTGEAIDKAEQAAKIKSRRTPSFQCIDSSHTFWALPRNNRADAVTQSSAAKIAADYSGAKVVPTPASAPKQASCLEYSEGPRYSCYFPWRNLTLLATSSDSVEDAGAVLSGGLATVEAVYAAK